MKTNLHKNMFFNGALASVVGLLLITSSAQAQRASGRSDVDPQKMLDLCRNEEGLIELSKLPTNVMPENVVEKIENADKNKDGFLDSAEEKNLATAFGNRKNAASRNAQTQMRTDNRAAAGGGSGRGAAALDALRNNDGLVELAKISKDTPEFFVSIIKDADKDADGILSTIEEKALIQSLANYGGQRRNPAQGGLGKQGGNGVPITIVTKKREALTDKEKNDLDALRRAMMKDGVAFLTKIQGENGSFSANPRVGIGPTLIDAVGLLRAGVSLNEPVLAKAMNFLENSVHEDGGVYSEGMHLSTYESCLGLVCFMLANKQAGDGRYDDIVKNAETFVRGSQYNGDKGYSRDDEYFGGVGYGNNGMTRPDLSNTQFFIEALREVGAGEDDPAIQDALTFVSRCQNLESQDSVGVGAANNKEKTSNDGGFIYTFVNGDQNPAGQEVSGGLRSYGSITYAGLKSLIYAGLKADDPRVAAATNWIRDNYTMDQNPGLGKKGLYYYYHTLSKCFKIIGDDLFEDKDGVKHEWRKELVEKLALAENSDGSWTNDDRMWFENDPSLVTGYVLIVLSYCSKGENNDSN